MQIEKWKGIDKKQFYIWHYTFEDSSSNWIIASDEDDFLVKMDMAYHTMQSSLKSYHRGERCFVSGQYVYYYSRKYGTVPGVVVRGGPDQAYVRLDWPGPESGKQKYVSNDKLVLQFFNQ